MHRWGSYAASGSSPCFVRISCFFASTCVYVTLFPVAYFISSVFVTSTVRFELRIYETLVSNFLFGVRVAKGKKREKTIVAENVQKALFALVKIEPALKTIEIYRTYIGSSFTASAIRLRKPGNLWFFCSWLCAIFMCSALQYQFRCCSQLSQPWT